MRTGGKPCKGRHRSSLIIAAVGTAAKLKASTWDVSLERLAL